MHQLSLVIIVVIPNLLECTLAHPSPVDSTYNYVCLSCAYYTDRDEMGKAPLDDLDNEGCLDVALYLISRGCDEDKACVQHVRMVSWVL